MKYVSINAKVRAMGAQLFTAADYAALCEMKTPEEQQKWLNEDTWAQDYKKIMIWLHTKPMRDIITAFFPAADVAREIEDYLLLWKKIQRLDASNRAALLPLLGTEIDLTNITWLYRLNKYYSITHDAVYGRLIPIRYRLSRAIMQKMAACKNDGELLAAVAESPYSAVFPSFENAERRARYALAAQYKKAARAHPDSIAPVCRYLFAKQQEIRSIRTIAEGFRYGLAPAEIQKLVMAW